MMWLGHSGYLAAGGMTIVTSRQMTPREMTPREMTPRRQPPRLAAAVAGANPCGWR